jgi:hypothetical protein
VREQGAGKGRDELELHGGRGWWQGGRGRRTEDGGVQKGGSRIEKRRRVKATRNKSRNKNKNENKNKNKNRSRRARPDATRPGQQSQRELTRNKSREATVARADPSEIGCRPTWLAVSLAARHDPGHGRAT